MVSFIHNSMENISGLTKYYKTCKSNVWQLYIGFYKSIWLILSVSWTMRYAILYKFNHILYNCKLCILYTIANYAYFMRKNLADLNIIMNLRIKEKDYLGKTHIKKVFFFSGRPLRFYPPFTNGFLVDSTFFLFF